MLAAHVTRLDRNIAALCAGRGSADQQAVLKHLRDRLQSFRADCNDAKLGPGGDRQVAIEPDEPWGEGLRHCYQLLASPARAKAKAPEPGTSDCIIHLREDLGDPPFKGRVFLDPSLATTVGPIVG